MTDFSLLYYFFLHGGNQQGKEGLTVLPLYHFTLFTQIDYFIWVKSKFRFV